MSKYDPSGLTDRLVDIAAGLLTIALALYGTVMLIKAIWPWLLIGAGLLLGLLVAGWLVRMRFGRW